MSKSGKNVDYAAALENSFARWDYIREHGCSDPFWADGVNMNLVRNHIMYYKQKLNIRIYRCFRRWFAPCAELEV